jgi:hypothetical protein
MGCLECSVALPHHASEQFPAIEVTAMRGVMRLSAPAQNVPARRSRDGKSMRDAIKPERDSRRVLMLESLLTGIEQILARSSGIKIYCTTRVPGRMGNWLFSASMSEKGCRPPRNLLVYKASDHFI